jgi:hypothetical protein
MGTRGVSIGAAEQKYMFWSFSKNSSEKRVVACE